jgi:MFS family permease
LALVATRWRILREVLGERDLGRLHVTVGLWATADAAFLLTVSVTAYDLGGPSAVGLVGAVRVLPVAVTSSATALVADRMPRTRLIAAVSLGAALACVAMSFVVEAGSGLPVLVAVQAIGSLAAGWVKPSLQALVPQLVRSPERLLPSATMWSFLNGAGSMLGPAGVGLLLVVVDRGTVFAVLAAWYVVTGLVAASVRTPFQPARTPVGPGVWTSWRHWVAGLTPFDVHGGRTFLTLYVVQRLVSGLLTAFVVIYAYEIVADGDALSGGLLAGLGFGGLVGAAAAMVTFGRIRTWYAAAAMLTAAPLVAVGLTRSPWAALAALVVSGAGASLFGIFASAFLNRWLPDHVAARAWGLLIGLGALAAALGSLAAPRLSAWLGVGDALVVVGAVAAVLPLVFLRSLGTLETRNTPPPEVQVLLAGTRALATLPDLFLSRLACVARTHEAAAGEAVVRQGEPGEDFYVVAAGELVVTRDGGEVRRLGPGDSFGEVALLRTVPRTATVVAAAPSTLVSLGHDAFVHIVTGHGPTDEWADSAVSGLLAEDERRTSS